uniref:G1/S-specific cyclin-E2-like n=1 Tax=Sinocyclocheilus grahami TaxID=75366 RepID=A0A672PIB6_SINGR
MSFGIKDHFDPYNVFLVIATNIPQRLKTAFVLQGHKCQLNIFIMFVIYMFVKKCFEWHVELNVYTLYFCSVLFWGSWGSSEDVWMKMLSKEIKYEHSKSSLDRHPSLRPKMRAMLLDWLMEVCESYTLHRQTFYLAQDFFDRYMLSQSDVQKDQLQLIGITALFISSKIEEIYPPQITELAYVSDGACLEEEILQMELIMLKALNWDLCPETVLSWMKLYIQIASLYDLTNLLVAQFPQETYIQITQLLDLCILDINSLDFKYGVLAAAAFCHFMSADVVQKVSGLKWEAIETCVNWMAPFVETLMCYKSAQLKEFGQVPSEDRHNIQTHGDYLCMLKEAQEKQSESLEHFFPPTPPSSAEKPS